MSFIKTFFSLAAIRVLCLILLACGVALSARAADAPAATPTILVLGDSLSAGYGIRVEQSWVALLQARLRAKGYGYRVVNASSSGETTGGALARLPRALDTHRPVIVIVELGGNDGLRGLPITETRKNLQQIIDKVKAKNPACQIVLAGMMVPPNMGKEYSDSFRGLFPEIARKNSALLVPFLLDGVAGVERLNQADGIHPTAEGRVRPFPHF